MNKYLCFLAMCLSSCSLLDPKTVEVEVPAYCGHGLEIISEALQSQGSKEKLLEIADKYDYESLECAVELFLLQRGGIEKLTHAELALYSTVKVWLEQNK